MSSNEVYGRTFKLALLGDAAVAKTCSALRFAILPERNRGNVSFEIWDTAGDQGSANRLGEYLKSTDAAIIMFDVSRRKTWESVVKWHRELVSVNQKDIPVVVCGNKADSQCQREVKPEDISFPDEMSGVQYYETSVRTDLNFEAPFLWLTRILLDDHTLEWGTNVCVLAI